ncbi:hypothetical protein ACFX13_020970 [Malus domestica]
MALILKMEIPNCLVHSVLMATWASTASSITLNDASIAKKHEQWMAEYGRIYAASLATLSWRATALAYHF